MICKTNKIVSMELNNISGGKFLDPVSIIGQLGDIAGKVAADFGCGSGYFSIPFAQAIGVAGHLYSFDVLPQALEAVEGRAKLLGISNITTKRANLENDCASQLEAESVDWVILKDMLFQNKNKEAIFKEAHRILKPGGHIVVVEWNGEELSIGPAAELRIAKDDLKALFEPVGFDLQKEVDAGKFHYSLVLEKIKK